MSTREEAIQAARELAMLSPIELRLLLDDVMSSDPNLYSELKRVFQHNPDTSAPAKGEIAAFRKAVDIMEMLDEPTPSEDDFTMSRYASKADLHDAMRDEIRSLKARLTDMELERNEGWAKIDKLSTERDEYVAKLVNCSHELRELGVKHQTLSAERDLYRGALERIANEDFRGNRPQSADIAYRALKEVGEEG